MSSLYRISKKQQAILLPHDPAIAATLPRSKAFVYEGTEFLAVKHTASAQKILNNIGYNIPAPILYHYDWRETTPFDVQVHTAAMLTTHERAYVLNSIGTGKTRAALFSYDFLRQQGYAKKMLVIAPLSTLTTVWDRECFMITPNYSVGVLHGSRAKRLKILDQDHDIYVVNHDGIKIKQLADLLAKRTDIDVVVIDELAAFRNRNERWKAADKICKSKKFVWGMTGSPTPQAPTDAYAQIKLLTPHTLPSPWFKHFRELTMRQITQFKWLPKKDSSDVVFRCMQPGVRYTQEDCVDLPPLLYTTVASELSKEQKLAYGQMQTKMAVDFQQGGKITAVNAGVQMGKLLQIAAGFLYDEDRNAVSLNPANKLAALRQLIEDADKKVIVYCPFIQGVDMLAKELSNDYDVLKVYGDTKKADRDAIFLEFQNSDGNEVLVAHPQVMAHGLTLTAASVIAWWSPTTSNEIYEQACGRIRRPGQDTKCLIAHIQSSPVEKVVYKSLETKGDTQAVLLNMYHDLTEG